MVVVGREQHVLREVDLHAVALPDGYRWRNLHEPIQDRCRGLGDTGGRAVGELLRAGADEAASTLG